MTTRWVPPTRLDLRHTTASRLTGNLWIGGDLRSPHPLTVQFNQLKQVGITDTGSGRVRVRTVRGTTHVEGACGLTAIADSRRAISASRPAAACW
jgi:hypothetical protein